jgi:hypothetical protein
MSPVKYELNLYIAEDDNLEVGLKNGVFWDVTLYGSTA